MNGMSGGRLACVISPPRTVRAVHCTTARDSTIFLFHRSNRSNVSTVVSDARSHTMAKFSTYKIDFLSILLHNTDKSILTSSSLSYAYHRIRVYQLAVSERELAVDRQCTKIHTVSSD